MVDAMDRICRLEAIEMGFKCVVIRGPIHDAYAARDSATGRIIGHRPVDKKMTVFMGESWDACQIEGHIYVMVDEDGLPTCRCKAS
jgi:hypothetical protein